jgi:hypothetical protein
MNRSNNDKSSRDPSFEVERSVRRRFLQALAIAPGTALLSQCGPEELVAVEQQRKAASAAREGGAVTPSISVATRKEQNRRRKLASVHVGEENEHDIDGLMATFAAMTVVIANGQPFTDLAFIRAAHIAGGFSDAPANFVGTRVVPQIEYVTDDEIVFEGLLIGRHVGTDPGNFPATDRELQINYVAFYRFDAEGKLISERLVLNDGVYALPPEPPAAFPS